MVIRSVFAVLILLFTSTPAAADDGGDIDGPVDTASPADAGRDASTDADDAAARDAAPVVLLPDGAARELIADDEGCGCAIDAAGGSLDSVMLTGGLFLVAFASRRRGRP